MSEEELSRRLYSLERRLDAYHDHLEAALRHDREFQMKATWGVVNSLVGISAFLIACYVTDHYLHMRGWILGTIAGFAALIAWGTAAAWSDRGREKDLDKLSRLPKWSDDDEFD
jgi:hypothetical protein